MQNYSKPVTCAFDVSSSAVRVQTFACDTGIVNGAYVAHGLGGVGGGGGGGKHGPPAPPVAMLMIIGQ